MMKDLLIYTALTVLGFLISMPYVEQLPEMLDVIGPISLTALFASLLVPFAGFTQRESWQKFAVQFGIVPLFGTYGAIMWHEGKWLGLFLLACAAIVHFGYWTASPHSRAYRLDLYHKAFSMQPWYPEEMAQIALLCHQKKGDAADEIVCHRLNSLGKEGKA